MAAVRISEVTLDTSLFPPFKCLCFLCFFQSKFDNIFYSLTLGFIIYD